MIIADTHHTETNLGESKEFTITQDSAKIFSMLSSKIYTDKERAVITELSSNALDAHITSDKADIPFKVVLPTDLSKEFRIRDYGTGLSEENVYKFLTGYGASNKTSTNNLVGGFGIGSKSPAAVTDSWTIVSNHAGKSSKYIIHVGNNGIPKINKLFEIETEESGLEVIIPVKSTYPWVEGARKAYEFYHIKPEIKNFIHNTIKHDIVLDSISIGGNSYVESNYNGSINLVMNNRCYTLDTSKFDQNIIPSSLSIAYLYFPTASLSVSLSREDLQYDDNTIKTLTERFEAIKLELSSLWKGLVSTAMDEMEYRIKASAFIDKYKITSPYAKNIALECGDIFTNVDFNRLYTFNVNIASKSVIVMEKTSRGSIKTNTIFSGKYSGTGYKIFESGATTTISHIALQFSMRNDNVHFVLNDDKHFAGRIRNAMLTGKIKATSITVVDADTFKMIPSYFTKHKASDLPKKEIIRQPKVPTIKTTIDSEIYKVYGGKFIKVLESEIDKSVPVVFIKFKYANSTKTILDEFDKKFDTYNIGAYSKYSVIYIKESTTPPSYAISLKEYVEHIYTDLNSKTKLFETFNSKVQILHTHGFIKTLYENSHHFNNLETNTYMKTVSDELVALKNIDTTSVNISKAELYEKVCQLLNKNVDISDVNLYSSGMLEEQILKLYPLIKGLYKFDTQTFENIVEYVNALKR